MLMPGSVLEGKYQILRRIGQGGMSNVYLAVNREADCRFAVKEIRREGRLRENFVRERLISEKEILKQLSHPGIVRIIDVIDHHDLFYLIMSYAEGVTLQQEQAAGRKLSAEQVLADAMRICEILGYLHSRKKPILYQDLKPSNLIRGKDGSLMLIDFGTAREYRSGQGRYLCLGTKGYAAPEQYQGMNAGAATDIYAFGRTLLQLLTGEPPWKESAAADRKATDACSRRLQKIAAKCCRQEPSRRYASCAELYMDLVLCKTAEHHRIILPGMFWQILRRGKEIRRYERFMETYGSYEKTEQEVCEIYHSWEEILIPVDLKQKDLRIDPEQPQVRRFSRNGLIMEKEICLACEIEQTIKLL